MLCDLSLSFLQATSCLEAFPEMICFVGWRCNFSRFPHFLQITRRDDAEKDSNCHKTLSGSFTITKEAEPEEHSQHKDTTTEKEESVRKEGKKEKPKKPRPASFFFGNRKTSD